MTGQDLPVEESLKGLPPGAEGLSRGWCGVCLRTRISPSVITVKRKQKEWPASGLLGVGNLCPVWSWLPGRHWPGRWAPHQLQGPGACPPQQGPLGRPVWPPRRWSVAVPAPGPHTQVCVTPLKYFPLGNPVSGQSRLPGRPAVGSGGSLFHGVCAESEEHSAHVPSGCELPEPNLSLCASWCLGPAARPPQDHGAIVFWRTRKLEAHVGDVWNADSGTANMGRNSI